MTKDIIYEELYIDAWQNLFLSGVRMEGCQECAFRYGFYDGHETALINPGMSIRRIIEYATDEQNLREFMRDMDLYDDGNKPDFDSYGLGVLCGIQAFLSRKGE